METSLPSQSGSQARQFVACSRYLVQKWLPLLGGTGFSMVLYLRSLGYYNPATGERRNAIRASLRQIAAACNCSERTIQREIERNEALKHFMRIESRFAQSRDGRMNRLMNVYHVAMEDPIAPGDDEAPEGNATRRGALPDQPVLVSYSTADRFYPWGQDVYPCKIVPTPGDRMSPNGVILTP